ncbi:MAG: FIST N-terminal domain-containing protein [Bacteroidota bacterium]
MLIKTIHADSEKGFQQSYISAVQDGFRPTVAMVFASVDIDLKGISSFLGSGQVEVFGCSSCGEFVYDADEQIITDGAVVCLLMDLAPGTFRIKLFPGEATNSFDLGSLVGSWSAGTFSNPALFILASGLATDGEQLVRGIQHAAGENIKMFGGLAGDDAQFKDTFVFSSGTVENSGAIAMVLDQDKYSVDGIATSGWVSIGADKQITQSEGNIVYTIDDQPALDVYKDYLSVRDEDLPEIGIEYPLMIKKPGRQDVLRAVINVDREKRSLIFAGSVPKGSVVSFSSSPGFEVIEYTRQMVDKFYRKNPGADVLILFSCMARHSALGPAISEEIDDAWGKWKTPLVGFFTYGEIGNNYSASCDFYNQTFTLVALKEK